MGLLGELFLFPSDQEILEHVTQVLDDRRQQFAKAEHNKGLISLGGSLVYGKADAPRKAQIQQGVTYYQTLRVHQQHVIATIEALKQGQR